MSANRGAGGSSTPRRSLPAVSDEPSPLEERRDASSNVAEDLATPAASSAADDDDNPPPPGVVPAAAASRAHSDGLTRAEVASALRVSVSTVRRLQARGELHASRRADGVHLFDAVEVRALAAKHPRALPPVAAGELAAAAFRLFEAGRELAQIVEELRQPPEVIRELYWHFKTPLTDGYMIRRATDARRAKEHLQRIAEAEAHESRRQDRHEAELLRLSRGGRQR